MIVMIMMTLMPTSVKVDIDAVDVVDDVVVVVAVAVVEEWDPPGS